VHKIIFRDWGIYIPIYRRRYGPGSSSPAVEYEHVGVKAARAGQVTFSASGRSRRTHGRHHRAARRPAQSDVRRQRTRRHRWRSSFGLGGRRCAGLLRV